MANIISTINLCSVPINPTNQIDFGSREEQERYFNSKSIKTCYPCKYTARNGSIKVKGYVDEFNNCNYGFYTNEYNGISKTFYFWIANKEALSKNTTLLTIQLDVFQTWYFDLTFKPCFIERQHVIDDRIGANTFPEDFELGDYVTTQEIEISEMLGDMAYFVAISEYKDGTVSTGGIFGKKYTGLTYVYFSQDSYRLMGEYIQEMCNEGKGDAIAYIFMFPKALLNSGSSLGQSLRDGDQIGGIEGTIDSLINLNIDTNNFETWTCGYQTYKPFNNKLFTYPFSFLTVNNAEGGNVVWKLENFTDKNNIQLLLESVLAPDSTFSLTPINYCGRVNSYIDSISSNGYGLCSWNNDNYSNWFAQNKNSWNAQSMNANTQYLAQSKVAQNNYNTAKQNIKDTYNTSEDIRTWDLIGDLSNSVSLDFIATLGDSATSGINWEKSGLSNALTKKTGNRSNRNDLQNAKLLNNANYEMTMRSLCASHSDAMVQPNTSKGDTSACGLDVARDSMTFYIRLTQIKPEYAKKIDTFFQMYGYQVNVVEVPQIRTRQKWNYLKTTNCTTIGNVPLEDRQAFENILNDGLTIWHNEHYMYDYLKPNPIILTD